MKSLTLNFSDDFFFTSPAKHLEGVLFDEAYHKLDRNKSLRVIISNTLTSKESSYVESLVRKSIPEEVEIKFQKEDRSDPNWIKRLISNKDYDIRVARVDIGGVLDDFIVNMMFCTKLGVSFPDPTGKICKLVESIRRKKIDNLQYQDEFNNLYQNDASVIPLWHSGTTWLLSDNISLKDVSSLMELPRFDQLEL